MLAEAMRYDGEGFSIPSEHAKKAGRREMHARKTRRREGSDHDNSIKKDRKFMTGTSTPAKLMSTSRRYDLFVFHVNENATADGIKDYINCHNMAVIDIDCMSNENHYTNLPSHIALLSKDVS